MGLPTVRAGLPAQFVVSGNTLRHTQNVPHECPQSFKPSHADKIRHHWITSPLPIFLNSCYFLSPLVPRHLENLVRVPIAVLNTLMQNTAWGERVYYVLQLHQATLHH